MQNCFSDAAPCATCSRYAQGTWQRTPAAPSYRFEHALWKKMNVRSMPVHSNHHWGLCDDVASGSLGSSRSRFRSTDIAKQRQRFVWEPTTCQLHSFDRAAVCDVLRGQQILVVGDSATAQFFLSLVLQLGGPEALGYNRRGGSAVLKDITASACGDTVRLNFVRNDLLLWTSQVDELRELGKSCTAGRALLQPFANRVGGADLLVLGTGHHYPHVVRKAGEPTNERLFTRSLNHTLSSAIAARAKLGHSAGSIVLLGAPSPVAGCSRHSEPISSTTALLANSSLNRWSESWQHVRALDEIAQRLAAERSANYLDFAPLSMQRPDDTLGREHRRVPTRAPLPRPRLKTATC